MPRNPKSRKRGWHDPKYREWLFDRKPKRESQPKPPPEVKPPPADGINHKRLAAISKRARHRVEAKMHAVERARCRTLADNTARYEQVARENDEEYRKELEENDA